MKCSRHVLAVGLVTAVLFCFVIKVHAADQGKTFTIGAEYPLSGHAAIYGNWMLEGAMCAVKEANEKGWNLKLIAEDDAGETTKALSAFNKLARVDKVPFILSGFSTVVMATSPIAARNKIVILNTSASSPDLEKAGPYTFSDLPNLTQEIKVLAQYVKTNMPNVKKVATFVTNDVFGIGAREAVIADFGHMGIKVVGGEFMPFQASSYKTQLAKLNALGADAIYMASYGKQDMILAFKQAKELNMKTQWLGFEGMATPGVWEQSEGGNEGAVFTQPPFDPQSDNPITKDFVKRYKEKTGKMPELYAANAYDAVNLFLAAAQALSEKHMAVNGENIRKFLLEKRKFNTATGQLIFQDNGTCIKPVAIRKVEKGKFVTLTVLSPKQ